MVRNGPVDFDVLRSCNLRKVDDRIKYEDSPELLNFILTEVSEFADSNSKITLLDVGAGDGYVLSRVKDILEMLGTKYSLIASDTDSTALSKASEPVQKLNLDAMDLKDLGDGSIDLYLSNFVMRYVDSREKMVSEMSRVISSDGKAILLLWMKNSMLSRAIESLYTLNLLHVAEFNTLYKTVKEGKRPEEWKEIYSTHKTLGKKGEDRKFRDTLTHWEKQSKNAREELADRMEKTMPALQEAIQQDRKMVELDFGSIESEQEIYTLFSESGLEISKIEPIQVAERRFEAYRKAGCGTSNLAWGVVLKKSP